jgi:hypothetical protein
MFLNLSFSKGLALSLGELNHFGHQIEFLCKDIKLIIKNSDNGLGDFFHFNWKGFLENFEGFG